MTEDRTRGIDRREFVKVAVAIGGTNALAACLSREGSAEADPEFPQGPTDLSSIPERQHAWGQFIVHDAHNNTVLPQHHLLLFLNYTGSGTPSESDRSTVEAAFQQLEQAFQRGTGGDLGASINRGLLFTIGYSPSYFDRFDESLPDSIDLTRPETVLEEVDEDPSKAEHYDALLLLTADFGSILLSAEEALFGNLEEVNGVDVQASIDGIFEKADRRTGFVGKGLPAEKIEEERIPDHAPLSMGFKSGFTDNLPSEDAITIDTGPYAEGTTQQASRLLIDLDRWYDQDEDSRIEEMFSPHHSHEDVGDTGERLGDDSGITEEMVESIESDAEETGVVGHTAKTARARTDDFQPVILRRSEGVATDIDEPGHVGFNFTAVQEGIGDFIDTRKTMNPAEYDVDVDDPHHGIFDYLTTVSRATYLMPPRSLRSLPTPRPDRNGA